MVKKKSVKLSVKNGIRPPIVAVLGHVDHGKTSLISQIYQKDLTRKEAGGISQHLGAYQVNFQNKTITLIDTPGHVAFSQMRSRGAQVADLVVLVVAADEGVKPQTLESLKHIQAAKIPYLVALNKIDLPEANIERVKADLAKNNILVEGYGGDIVVVPVSAKTGQGIDQLLEMVLLLAEMAQLRTTDDLEGVVIESKLDPQKGPTATIILRSGNLSVGQTVPADGQLIKIRAMFNDRRQLINQAGPSQPVEIWGFKEVLAIGTKIGQPEKTIKKTPTIAPIEVKTDEKKIKIILKTDVIGTLEAIQTSLPSEIQLIKAQAGSLNESDVLLAVSTGAEIIGFNLPISSSVKKLAEIEKIKIKSYRIIYELLEDLEKRILKILEPTIDQQILGQAKIVALFEIKGEKIAGCRVTSGQISKNEPLHLKRQEEIIADLTIKSMKIGKQDANLVSTGQECGLVFTNQIDFKIDDVLISFNQRTGN